MKLSHHFSTLGSSFSSQGQIQPLTQQTLSYSNDALAAQLDINLKHAKTLNLLLGNEPISGALSMVYAGHQFGGFTPQLGDGRGLLLGEVTKQDGQIIDLHMKGSGPTPYSRRGDGRAVLSSSIREYLASEALHHLGISSTRALALFTSDQYVYREQAEPAAMLLRSARSHIRFGHFEYFFYQKKAHELDSLIDYVIDRYFKQPLGREENILFMLESIVDSTAKMIAQWQAVGFQHGVMNTDNMSILGETIDYGPYGFMESYQPRWVSNQSDYEARYAFERQPGVALWNLNCLFHCFSNHLTKSQLVKVLSQFEARLMGYFQTMIRSKLGFILELEDDQAMFSNLLLLLEKEQVDYTSFWRNLSQMKGANDRLLLIADFDDNEAINLWLNEYCDRRKQETRSWEESRVEMLKFNPKYILRNYLAQNVISAAEGGSFKLFDELMQVLKQPFDEHETLSHLAIPANSEQQKICISCSS
ncbi:MAG: protein adenylyltransferase SelO [Marinomonas sp.]